MKKPLLYPKLAWQGIRKNAETYLPYLLMGILMVGVSYIMNYLTRPTLMGALSMGGTTLMVLQMGKIVISVFSVIFLYYCNSFLIRRRMKEFGLYNILGMGKGNIARVMLWETLLTALLVVGIRFAGKTYTESMRLSEAQELCSTLTSVISDKLRFCGTVTPGADGSLDHIFIQDLGSVEGEGAAFQVDADGQLTLGSTKLLSSAAYPRGLRVRDVSLRYDSASGIFTVALQVGTADSTLAETDFEVRRLNHT